MFRQASTAELAVGRAAVSAPRHSFEMAMSDDVHVFALSVVGLGLAYVACRFTVPKVLPCKDEKELRRQRAWCVVRRPLLSRKAASSDVPFRSVPFRRRRAFVRSFVPSFLPSSPLAGRSGGP